jgi:transcriptional pleiotropic repressor
MEMPVLLEKTRTLHQLLQKSAAQQLDLQGIAAELATLMEAQTYIIGKKGMILGQGSNAQMIEPLFYPEEIKDQQLAAEQLEWCLSFNKTEINRALADRQVSCLLVPVQGTGERIATIIFAREQVDFENPEIILAEYGASVVAMQMQRSQELKLELEARKKNVVQLALEVLSYSELEAVKYIFQEIHGNEGFLVASKLAEEYRLTRSVIVNALRKLESAGVIDARSLGMKGTYIKVLNDCLYQELAVI